MTGESNYNAGIEIEIGRLLSEYRTKKSRNDYIAAAESLKKAEELSPGNIKIIALKADEAFDREDYLSAKPLYAEVFERDKQNFKAESRLKIIDGMDITFEEANIDSTDNNDSNTENSDIKEADEIFDQPEEETEKDEADTDNESYSGIIDSENAPKEKKDISKVNVDISKLSARETAFVLSVMNPKTDDSAKGSSAVSGFIMPSPRRKKETDPSSKALISSVFLPGLGQIHNDEIGKGLIIALGYIFALMSAIGQTMQIVNMTKNLEYVGPERYVFVCALFLLALGLWIYAFIDTRQNS